MVKSGPVIVRNVAAIGQIVNLPYVARLLVATGQVVSELESAAASALAAAAQQGFKCLTLLKWFGKGAKGISVIGGIFLLFEVSAKAGEYLPPIILPDTIARLQAGGLKERCGDFHTWFKGCYFGSSSAIAPGISCQTCFDRSIANHPRCDSSASDTCTWCSQSATNQNAAYQDLRRGVENGDWDMALRCAGKPGGYFMRQNQGQTGLWNRIIGAGGWWGGGNLKNAICPY
jgi:hypothetical protein